MIDAPTAINGDPNKSGTNNNTEEPRNWRGIRVSYDSLTSHSTSEIFNANITAASIASSTGSSLVAQLDYLVFDRLRSRGNV